MSALSCLMHPLIEAMKVLRCPILSSSLYAINLQSYRYIEMCIYLFCHVRPGKLNSQFIVTRPHGILDFPKFISDSIVLYGQPPLALALLSGLWSSSSLWSVVSCILYYILNNLNIQDRPPACKTGNVVTIDCEFSLPGLTSRALALALYTAHIHVMYTR